MASLRLKGFPMNKVRVLANVILLSRTRGGCHAVLERSRVARSAIR